MKVYVLHEYVYDDGREAYGVWVSHSMLPIKTFIHYENIYQTHREKRSLYDFT